VPPLAGVPRVNELGNRGMGLTARVEVGVGQQLVRQRHEEALRDGVSQQSPVRLMLRRTDAPRAPRRSRDSRSAARAGWADVAWGSPGGGSPGRDNPGPRASRWCRADRIVVTRGECEDRGTTKTPPREASNVASTCVGSPARREAPRRSLAVVLGVTADERCRAWPPVVGRVLTRSRPLTTVSSVSTGPGCS
jgi:hypothetical protein